MKPHYLKINIQDQQFIVQAYAEKDMLNLNRVAKDETSDMSFSLNWHYFQKGHKKHAILSSVSQWTIDHKPIEQLLLDNFELAFELADKAIKDRDAQFVDEYISVLELALYLKGELHVQREQFIKQQLERDKYLPMILEGDIESFEKDQEQIKEEAEDLLEKIKQRRYDTQRLQAILKSNNMMD